MNNYLSHRAKNELDQLRIKCAQASACSEQELKLKRQLETYGHNPDIWLDVVDGRMHYSDRNHEPGKAVDQAALLKRMEQENQKVRDELLQDFRESARDMAEAKRQEQALQAQRKREDSLEGVMRGLGAAGRKILQDLKDTPQSIEGLIAHFENGGTLNSLLAATATGTLE